MGEQQKQLRLGAFLPGAGQHVAAWRHPLAQTDGALNFEHYKQIAQTAERGKFDAFFLADGLALQNDQVLKDVQLLVETLNLSPCFQPLSAVTERIGFIATASTTYEDPYILARKFASLDHLSGGRAGWNVVTTGGSEAAGNFGFEAHPNHAERYVRAHEFIDVVKGLWDTWEDDAFIRDKETAFYYDPNKVHQLNHKGRFFSVRRTAEHCPSTAGVSCNRASRFF